MKKFIPFLTSITLLINACTAQAVATTLPTSQPTNTVAPTSTPSPTHTPLPTHTATPFIFTLQDLVQMSNEDKISHAPEIEGHTAFRAAERYVLYETSEGERDVAYDLTTGEQVEIPNYQITTPEKFYSNEIPQEDLENGKYWLWLNTLDVEFDLEKIKDVPIVYEQNNQISWLPAMQIYHDSGPSAPADFGDPATAPFDRDVTSGVVIYHENGIESFAILRPVAFFDAETGQVNWVVAINSFIQQWEDESPTTAKISRNLTTWRDHYNVTPLVTNFYSVDTGFPDPVLQRSYELYPDVDNRFVRFANGDLSALSAPGLVVQTGSNMRTDSNRFK